MGRGWLLAGLLLSLACLAQPPSSEPPDPESLSLDAAQVRECFVQMGQGAVADCIGLAANACQQGPGGATTLGIVDCLAEETRAWDELLNAQYQALRTRMREQDEGNPEHAISRVDALRDMQRAWIALRDAECGYAYARYQDGSIRNVVAAACRLEQTAERALALKGILHERSL